MSIIVEFLSKEFGDNLTGKTIVFSSSHQKLWPVIRQVFLKGAKVVVLNTDGVDGLNREIWPLSGSRYRYEVLNKLRYTATVDALIDVRGNIKEGTINATKTFSPASQRKAPAK